MLIIASYIFSSLLVAMYSFFAFNRPRYPFIESEDDDPAGEDDFWRKARPGLPQYMTEPYRFQVYRLIFIMFAIGECMFIAQFLPIMPAMESILGKNKPDEAIIRAFLPFVSALLMLGLVQYIKWPRKILFGLMKGWLHYFADIPKMGRIIFENLCFQTVDYECDVAKKNIQDLLAKNHSDDNNPRKDLLESDFRVGNTRNIIWKWASLSYGIHIVEEWSRDPMFHTHLQERSLGWLHLHDGYIKNVSDMIRYRAGSLDEDATAKLNDRIETILANCHRLMACLVFMVAKPTKEDTLMYLKNAGYPLFLGERFEPCRGECLRIVFAMAPTILLFLLAYSAVTFQNGEYSLLKLVQEAIRSFISALIILVLPVFFVLAAKRLLPANQWWRTVTKNDPYPSFFQMPFELYAILSLAAWVMATALMMLYIKNSELKTMSVYGLIGAISAFFTAYRVDILPRIYPDYLRCIIGRTKGALLQGALTASIVWTGLMISREAPEGPVEWKYPLLGFVVAMVLNYTLFYGKHILEHRNALRNDVNSPVTAFIDGVSVEATLVNESTGGANIRVQKNPILAKGSKIKLVTDNNTEKFGQVIATNGYHLHVGF